MTFHYRLAIVTSIVCLVIAPALATISLPWPGPGIAALSLSPTVTNQGGSSNVSGATLTLAVNAASGSTVVVCVNEFGTATSGTMSDSVNGAYTLAKAQSDATGPAVTQAFVFPHSVLLSSATITYTKSISGDHTVLWAVYVSNLPTGAVDSAVSAGVSSTAANPPVISLTSGTPSIANEVFVACAGGENNGTFTYTPDTGHGWNTPPPFSLMQSGSTNSDAWLAGGYLVNTGTGTKIFNPSIGIGNGNRVADTVIIGLK